MTDALVLLKQDHKTVEQLFKKYEKTTAPQERRTLVDRIVRELSVHAAIEEQVFYPVVRMTVPDAEDITLESLEEHHIVVIQNRCLLVELRSRPTVRPSP